MKNLFFAVLSLLTAIAVAQVSHSFTSQIADYQITTEQSYKVVTHQQTGNFTTQVGAPQLPVVTKNFVLPAGSTVTNISISNQNQVLIASNLLLYPAQPPQDWVSEPVFVTHNPIIYNSANPYPATTVVQTAEGSSQGYHIVTLDICPFKYIPLEKKLYLYRTVNITVQYTIGNIEKTEKITKFRHDLNKEWLASQVANPELLNAITPTAKTILDETPETDKLVLHWKPSAYDTYIPDYIIITNEALKPEFQQLADYKTKRGFPTLVVTTEQIYPTFPGVDNAEKIRNYLKAAHRHWGNGLFVLLGGDTPIIPARIGDYHFDHNPTDLYYSDVYKVNSPPGYNYNWNQDGDQYFGETDDDGLEPLLGVDNYIGRAPVNTPQEALNFKNKTINYEKLNGLTTQTQRSYVNNMLFLGAYTFYRHETNTWVPGGQVWNYDLSDEPFLANNLSLKKWRLYDDHHGVVINDDEGNPDYTIYGDEELGKVTALDRMSNGVTGIGKFHLVSHYDHGGPFGVGVSGTFHRNSIYREDINALGNGNYLQIMYIPACEAGRFTLDSFAEHYVNKQNGGGVAILAHTATVPAGSGVDKVKKFFQSVYDNIEGVTHSYLLGIASTNARSAHSSFNTAQFKKVLTLFGDPTMMTWSVTPGTITLSSPTSISINNASDNTLTISTNVLLHEATITLYKFNSLTGYPEILATNYIPVGSTSTQFNLNPDTSGTLLITATARNYMPATKNVNIVMPQPHLYVTGFTFTDSNGNNHIEPGENISLTVQVKNSGGTAISNINTALSCNPDIALITQANASHSASVNPGQTIQLTGFTFTPLVEMSEEEIPDFIEFMLNITASGSYNHLDNFYLDMYSPVLELGARTMTLNGNIITPPTIPGNQEIDLKIAINNIGTIDTGALTAVLSTTLNNSVVQITTANGNYPNISARSEQTNILPFKFKRFQSTTIIPFTLTLTNALGKTWTFNFDMKEPFPPLITGFNFTSDNDQINLKWNITSTYTPAGYNIYRSDTENGTYVKMNEFLVTGTRTYSDYEVEENTEYYYKISPVSLSGNERPLENLVSYLAWTSLEQHGAFPITPDVYNKAESSSILYDVDNNGTKEIFVNYRKSDKNDGLIMGYQHDGEEIFDIDGIPTTISGFAATDISMLPNSAVGDIDGDGYAEVLSIGRNNTLNKGHLFVYKTIDEDNNSMPDSFWDSPLLDTGHRVYRNPVLYDINNDGSLEIIIANENQKIQVYDKNKNTMPGWPVQIPGGGDWSMGEIAVADLDNDGTAEIVFGVLKSNGTRGGLYVFNHDGTPFTINPFKLFENNERADGGISIADIDNDGQLEILATTRVSTTQGKIYAFNLDGTYVNTTKWNGNITYSLNSDEAYQHVIPRISVGQLNDDANLEVAFGSKNVLYVLKSDGTNLFTKSINDAKDSAPILADIDGNSDIEIIINSGGTIKAYKSNGNESIGWRLQSENGSAFVGSPSIDDIDNDGLNEVVISTADCTTYVWDTTGSADRIEWGSYRADTYNTGTYKNGCVLGTDLMIKDGPLDLGIEPNTFTQYMWTSEDIWVRNSNDNGLEHQNPEYKANGQPNYIKVKVTNRGCDPTTGTETLTMNWAKANTNLTYPENWDGSMQNNLGYLLGDEITGTPLILPIIQPGEEAIITIPWIVPNPDHYLTGYGSENPWHFCLLATILGASDPLTHPYTSNPNVMVKENNNQAWKNLTVVDLVNDFGSFAPNGAVAISNPHNSTKLYTLELVKDANETGQAIFDEAEVTIEMDDILFDAWTRGGSISQNLANKTAPNMKRVTANNVLLDNVSFNANEYGLLKLYFNFLTQSLTEKKEFKYHVIQREKQTGTIVGGETFVIKKNTRSKFEANAGDDKEVGKNQPVTLSAEDIEEPAVYNWYDSEGNLIYEGIDLQIPNAIAQMYQLEVISEMDGYKDYDEVEVKLKPSTLDEIAPNPASNNATITYTLSDVSSAYIKIVGYYENVMYNHILDHNESQTTIDVSAYNTGFYVVSLICDGQVVDSKTLIKQ